jgi:hypothetical protein
MVIWFGVPGLREKFIITAGSQQIPQQGAHLLRQWRELWIVVASSRMFVRLLDLIRSLGRHTAVITGLGRTVVKECLRKA